MKRLIISVACLVALLASQSIQAQGVITYLDNTGQPIAGNSVFGESIGVQFHTGTNVAGYALNSVQLLFANATGNPDVSGLNILISYGDSNGFGPFVTFLNSTSNPTIAGLYSYTPQTASTLASSTDYWLVAFINGSSFDDYSMSYASSTTATASDDWSITGSVVVGQTWIPIFAINATPVPEPSIFALLATALPILLFGNQTRRISNLVQFAKIFYRRGSPAHVVTISPH